MFKLNGSGILFIGLVLEGFFYGFYSGIYALYLQYHRQTSKKDTNKKQNMVFYSICVLYVLSVALFIAHNYLTFYQILGKPMVSKLRIDFTVMTLFGCCDFIAQFILIYRCWIVWGCNIRVVIIPSILSFAFLIIWLANGRSLYISSGELAAPPWGGWMTLSGLILSLTVNALVTGLIVFRIFKVFRQVRATSDDPILGATGGSKLRRILLILIESGMLLFSIQLVRVVVTIVDTDAAFSAYSIVSSIHNMLNGITPTIILVRTSMGLSFHDEKSMEEIAIGSLRFAPTHPNSVPETGNIDVVGQDTRGDDVGVQRSNQSQYNTVEGDEDEDILSIDRMIPN